MEREREREREIESSAEPPNITSIIGPVSFALDSTLLTRPM